MAIIPFQDEVIPLQNTRSQLNEAAARIVAFRPADAEVLGGLKDLDGMIGNLVEKGAK